jgi:hypothetical protein
MEEKKVTSIKVNPEQWKAVKKYCIDKNIEISAFLEDVINDALKKKSEGRRAC